MWSTGGNLERPGPGDFDARTEGTRLRSDITRLRIITDFQDRRQSPTEIETKSSPQNRNTSSAVALGRDARWETSSLATEKIGLRMNAVACTPRASRKIDSAPSCHRPIQVGGSGATSNRRRPVLEPSVRFRGDVMK